MSWTWRCLRLRPLSRVGKISVCLSSGCFLPWNTTTAYQTTPDQSPYLVYVVIDISPTERNLSSSSPRPLPVEMSSRPDLVLSSTFSTPERWWFFHSRSSKNQVKQLRQAGKICHRRMCTLDIFTPPTTIRRME